MSVPAAAAGGSDGGCFNGYYDIVALHFAIHPDGVTGSFKALCHRNQSLISCAVEQAYANNLHFALQ